jgi:hypothetical protein
MDILGGEGLVDNCPEDGRNQRRHTYQIKCYKKREYLVNYRVTKANLMNIEKKIFLTEEAEFSLEHY